MPADSPARALILRAGKNACGVQRAVDECHGTVPGTAEWPVAPPPSPRPSADPLWHDRCSSTSALIEEKTMTSPDRWWKTFLLASLCSVGCSPPSGIGVESSALIPTQTIDATGLSDLTLMVNASGNFDSATVHPVSLAPAPVGSYVLELGNGAVIGSLGINADGTFTYDATLDGKVFTGRNTTRLGVVPHPVHLDGTSLTKLNLLFLGRSLDSSTVQSFQLPSAELGSYPIELGNGGGIGTFGIAANGTFAYDATLDKAVFTGLGASTLRILPHAISIDASALTEANLLFLGRTFDSKSVQQLELPSADVGSYPLLIASGAGIGAFGISGAGALVYDAALDGGVLTGQGSSKLTVVAHPITIDATMLSQRTLMFYGGSITPAFDSKTVQHYALAAATPDSYSIVTGAGAVIGSFTVKPNGTLDYATALEGIFTGQGGTTLYVPETPAQTITIDATAKGAGSFTVSPIAGTFDRTQSQTIALVPSKSYTYSDDSITFPFSVDATGALTWAASVDDRVRGRGHKTLTIFAYVPLLGGNFSNPNWPAKQRDAGLLRWNDATRLWGIDLSDRVAWAGALWGSNGDSYDQYAGPYWGSDGPNFAGDVDGDGLTDVIIWNPSAATWEINLATGHGFHGEIWTGGLPGSDGPIFVGDLNGDGKADVFMHKSIGVWSVNISTGSGWKAQTWTNGQFASGFPVLTGDLNGDGKTDVFTWDDAYHVWRVLMSTGTGWADHQWNGDWGSDGPINTGDLNGDGKTDVFMWRASDKKWSVNLSTGTGFTAALWTGAWGSDGPIHVGDLNGDHKTDVVMWRGDSWSVNLSTGSNFVGRSWQGLPGTGGQVNVADLDGDGKDDVFVLQPGEKTWNVNISTGTGFRSATWNDAVPPVPIYDMQYGGGSLLGTKAPVDVYLLFYGTWAPEQKSYFVNLAKGLGASAWYATLTDYLDGTGASVRPGLNYRASHDDAYSHGKVIGDSGLLVPISDVQNILGDALNNDPSFQRDPNAVYLILTSSDVTVNSFVGTLGQKYAGYHWASSVGGYKYAVVASVGPNAFDPAPAGAGGMADTFAHELAEAITDPDGSSGWTTPESYTQIGGVEMGDLCEGHPGFGGDAPLLNGRSYDLKLGDQYYWVQGILTLEQHYHTGWCAQSLYTTPWQNNIGIQSAVYGDNCKAFQDFTVAAGQSCNGRKSCSIYVDPAKVVDPAPGCVKQFTVQWACADGPHLANVPGEAIGSTVNISCP
jgi:hypothetical protein